MQKRILGAALAGAFLATTAVAAGSYRVLERIKGPDGGWDFARVDTATNRLYVTRGTFVMAMDLASRKIVSGLAPGRHLHDALPVNGGRELLITDGDAGTAVFASAATGATIATVKVGRNPDAAALDPKTGLVLVMNHSDGTITLLDPRAHKAVGSIAVGGDLEVAAPDGSGRVYVNVEDKNETALIDVARRAVVRRFPLPGCDGPTGVAYDPGRSWVIASCDGATDVVNADTGALVKTLKTGKAADGVALDEKRKFAFVAGREGSLSVISLNGPSPSVVQVIKTARNNRTLALDPRNGQVYLPVADLLPAPKGQLPKAVPGTFRVLVVGS